MNKLICKHCGKEIKEPSMWGSAIVFGDPVVIDGKIYPKNMYVDPDDRGYNCEHCGKGIPNSLELESEEMVEILRVRDIF